MAVPWLRILRTAIRVGQFVRAQQRGRAEAMAELEITGNRAVDRLDLRLAGLVVAALKEVFDRDSVRLELEREQREEERRRVARAVRLEAFRQAGDREIGRLRLVAGTAVVSLIGTLFVVASGLAGAPAMARAAIGLGWLLLLGAVAAAFTAQSAIASTLRHPEIEHVRPDDVANGVLTSVAPWLVIVGLAFIGAGVLVT